MRFSPKINDSFWSTKTEQSAPFEMQPIALPDAGYTDKLEELGEYAHRALLSRKLERGATARECAECHTGQRQILISGHGDASSKRLL